MKIQQDNSDVVEQIEVLNGKIHELVERESLSLIKGKLLYKDIKKGSMTSGWSNDDYKCFIDYYKAIDFLSATSRKRCSLAAHSDGSLHSLHPQELQV